MYAFAFTVFSAFSFVTRTQCSLGERSISMRLPVGLKVNAMRALWVQQGSEVLGERGESPGSGAGDYLKAHTTAHTALNYLSWTSGSAIPKGENKGRSAQSQLFSVLGSRRWSELRPHVRIAEQSPDVRVLTGFRRRLKTHLFRVHLDSP